MLRLTLALIILENLQSVILSDGFKTQNADTSNYFHRRYTQARAFESLPPDSLCSIDSECSGYPLAVCDGTCKCVSGALNAGSTCISTSNALQPAGACPPGQTYITEAGACMTVQHPGEPCQYSQQCAAGEPGAYCLRLRCECVYGMRQSGAGCTFVNNECTKRGYIWISELGECREVLPPGGHGCSHNLQCTGAYPEATCFMQACTCPPNLPIAIDGTCGRNCTNGEVFSGVTGQCLPTVQPGGQCVYSSQCHAIYPGMICDKNVCKCPNGLKFSGNQCTQSCPSGMRLNSRGVCVEACRPTYVELDGDCLPQSMPSGACTVNAQCTGGSSCHSGICQCPIGMTASGSQCVQVDSPPLGSCRNGERCTGGSFCSGGNCTCPSGKQVVNDVCVSPQLVPIGGACVRVGVQCGGGSICVAGVCVCALGKTPRNGVCINHVSSRPGESCVYGDECTGNSFCNELTHQCECPSVTQMVIGGRCVERLRAHPGYSCTNGEMCIGGSVCADGKCQCEGDMIEINKICQARKEVLAGESCKNREKCVGGSHCDQESNICTCSRGFLNLNGECVEVQMVAPGERCAATQTRCTGGSYCARGRCECPLSMVPLNKKCVPQKQVAPGKPCAESDLCIGASVCRDGTCQCTGDMIIRGTICTYKRKVDAGSSCDDTDECMGGSNCVSGVCKCPGEQFIRSGICSERRNVLPGYLCEPEDICTAQSECVKGVCQCKAHHSRVNNQCIRNRMIMAGGICLRTDECEGEAQCIRGTCTCPEGKIAIDGECKLAPIVSLGESCTRGEICSVGVCDPTSKRCRCEDGLEEQGNACVKKTPPPALSLKTTTRRCVASNQCPSGADCVKGECKCQQGLALSRFGFCIPINYAEPGRSCAEGEVCRGDSTCTEGLCVCNTGFFLKENKCARSEKEKYTEARNEVGNNEPLTPCPTDGSCRLPNCFCSQSGTTPPGNFDRKSTPQMIVLTFDGPVTDRIINIYKSLFSGKLRNPNMCPIKGTFYLSHQWNNYDQSQWLASRGNEIGVNSITHEILSNKTRERWRHEMVGMRESLQEFSYVERAVISGMRAPHFMIGGDEQFAMMAENDFSYDNSMPTKEGPFWPQTLDHNISWDCGSQKCPTRPYKGIWEIPTQLIQSNDGIWYPTVAKALRPYDSKTSVRQLLARNFMRNYKTNRAPLVLSLDSEFLTYLPDNGAVLALEEWLADVLSKRDVYVVTASQVISWMKSPIAVNAIEHFRPWQCNFRMNDHIQPCETPSVCSYSGSSGGRLAHSFRVCGSCPKNYPWIEDPLGKRQL